jgi:hypothetical protein
MVTLAKNVAVVTINSMVILVPKMIKKIYAGPHVKCMPVCPILIKIGK